MCEKVPIHQTKATRPLLQWLLGMAVASVFSISYLLVPTYLIAATVALIFQYPSTKSSILFALPMLISILVPARPSRLALRLISPMLNYFEYEEVHTDERNIRAQMANGKSFIFAAQPHGVLSFVGMCAAATRPDDAYLVPTAVASVVLHTPLLKNLMGIFHLVDAAAGSLKKILENRGSVLILVGGIAEFFKSCPVEERLYSSKRKGFIKLALREGADVVPVYYFGNTSVLSVLKHGPLAVLSRKLGATFTLFWGKWGLPIPRDEKLLYVVGKQLGLPHISDPQQEDIDKWHALYCDEVRRLFEAHKEKVPMYKHKRLFID